MLGWVQVLRLRPRDLETTERGLSAIERNIQLQAQVLDDLLDMSQIAAGRVPLEGRHVSVRGVAVAALESIAPKAALRQVRLTQTLAPGEQQVLFDPAWLRRVIVILLSNALRFVAPGGLVHLELGPVASSLRIAVSDSSPEGVSNVSYVYDEFRDGPPSSTRELIELGIGPSNVQKVVEIYGGEVRAESTGFGRGAMFVSMQRGGRGVIALSPRAVRPPDSAARRAPPA
jgi:signal transduction histidine kinase